MAVRTGSGVMVRGNLSAMQSRAVTDSVMKKALPRVNAAHSLVKICVATVWSAATSHAHLSPVCTPPRGTYHCEFDWAGCGEEHVTGLGCRQPIDGGEMQCLPISDSSSRHRRRRPVFARARRPRRCCGSWGRSPELAQREGTNTGVPKSERRS